MSKQILLAGLVLLLGVFSFGYYEGHKSVQIASSATITEVKDKEVDKHVETVTTKDREGNVKIVTTVDTVARSTDNRRSDTVTTVTTVKALPKTNVSLLGGYDFQQKELIYGLSITKEVYGPLTVGVFGLNNKTAGLSVGISLP